MNAKMKLPTIYDGARYFDANFTDDERHALRKRIIDECGMDASDGNSWMMGEIFRVERELCAALGVTSVSYDWLYIHICRELEIDYKGFAKNEAKLPIEPFYRFAEMRFARFKPARNNTQLNVQTQHIHLAFLEWLESACPAGGCKKSEHWLWGCSDRFEEPDYNVVLERIWERNVRRPKLTLVHSA